MPLQALKIVKEETAKAHLSFEDDGRGHVSASFVNHRLDELQMKIVHRIENECRYPPNPNGVEGKDGSPWHCDTCETTHRCNCCPHLQGLD